MEGELETIGNLISSEVPNDLENAIRDKMARLKDTLYLVKSQGFHKANRYFEMSSKPDESGGGWFGETWYTLAQGDEI